jgi:hypothetical protein
LLYKPGAKKSVKDGPHRLTVLRLGRRQSKRAPPLSQLTVTRSPSGCSRTPATGPGGRHWSSPSSPTILGFWWLEEERNGKGPAAPSPSCRHLTASSWTSAREAAAVAGGCAPPSPVYRRSRACEREEELLRRRRRTEEWREDRGKMRLGF